ncbi:hypothetical protein DPM19_15845 [Actinomadura craniellae]|uniref:Uncharacterized protein n=1 Tax=Actinomadura craniellae TaxID=2231787 RepID=A0A365H5W3_9ACTN|nr:hypothetical protein DPM19_15845 [Actinomadura craniellae]
MFFSIALRALAALILLLPLASCDWKSVTLERKIWSSDPKPAGFAEHRGDDYRVAYPAGWTLRSGFDRLGHEYVEINGPATPEGAFSGRARVVRWASYPYQFEDRLVEYRRQADRADRTIKKDESLVLDRARRGHRFEYTAKVKTVRGRTVRVRATDTLALTEDGVLLEFSVTAADGAAAAARVAEVVGSFRIH